MSSEAEQAVSLAALILADESLGITPEKLQLLLKAAGIDNIEPIWTTLFANALKGKDVKQIVTAATAATLGPAASGPAGGKQTEHGGGEKKEDEDVDNVDISDSDSDIGMSLFD